MKADEEEAGEKDFSIMLLYLESLQWCPFTSPFQPWESLSSVWSRISND